MDGLMDGWTNDDDNNNINNNNNNNNNNISFQDKMTIVLSSIYPFSSSDGQTKSCQQNL